MQGASCKLRNKIQGKVQGAKTVFRSASLPVCQSKKILRINAKCKIVQSAGWPVYQSDSKTNSKLKTHNIYNNLG